MTEATQKAPGQPVAERETRSQWRDVWDQFTKHKGALIGGILFFAIVFAVMLGPSLWPYEANEINIRLRNQNPSWAHPFGTDQLGRDTFARMIAGGQTSITRQYGNNVHQNAYGPSISMHYTGPLTEGQYVKVNTSKPFHGSNGYFFGGYLIG